MIFDRADIATDRRQRAWLVGGLEHDANAACRSASGAGGGMAAVGQSDSLLTGSISFFRSSLRKSVIRTPLLGLLTIARGFGAGGGFGFDFFFGETVRFASAFAFFFGFFFI